MDYIYLTLVWTVWCFLHSFLISESVTAFLKRKMGKLFVFCRIFYNIFSYVTVIYVLKYQASLGGKPFIPFFRPWTPLQTGLVIFSVAVIFISFISYGPLEFLGISQIINRGKGKQNCSTNISTKGLLGIVRHPMYLAVLILVWTFNETPIDLLFNVIMTIYFIIGTHLEERKLIHAYGSEYEEYKKKVPMFVPFLYKITNRSS